MNSTIQKESGADKHPPWKLFLAVFLLVVIVFLVIFIYHFPGYTSIGAPPTYEWCVNNTGAYRVCRLMQLGGTAECNEFFNGMDAAVVDIEGEVSQCLFYNKMFEAMSRQNADSCLEIQNMEGYEKYGGFFAPMCYVLVSESKDSCSEMDEFRESDAKEFCNAFFDVIMANPDFQSDERFLSLDQESKAFVVQLKAIKNRDYALCEDISKYSDVKETEVLGNLSVEVPDYYIMYCHILAGNPEAKAADFCEPLISYCDVLLTL